MKRKKLVISLVIVGIIIAVVGIAIGIAVGNIEKNLAALNDIQIKNVDLAKVPDGVYTGSFKEFPVGAEVSVTVKDHLIKNVVLIKHENGQGSGAEILTSKVVETQSIELDAVSRATYSSKVILKAIENALNSGLSK